MGKQWFFNAHSRPRNDKQNIGINNGTCKGLANLESC